MSLEFTDKQKKYMHDAKARWNIKVGAVRSGKSFIDTAAMIPHRLRERKGKPGINAILGVSASTVERNVLQPMREIYGPKLIGFINNKNIANICGEPVYCIGVEKKSQVGKIQGSSIKYVCGDEIAKWNEDVFEMLKSRLDKPYSCLDGSCNPEGPNHWLKKFIERDDIDLYLQHYTLFDNPFLPNDYVSSLCKEYSGTVFYKRLILGEWALAEGLVYNMFSADRHIVNGKEYEYDPYSREPYLYFVSVDYGTVNPFAALLMRYDRKTKKSVAIKELYYTGRGDAPRVDNEAYYNMLCQLIGDIPIQSIIIDPSAASMVETIRKYGRYMVIPAVNDVLEGIQYMTRYLNADLLQIHECCENTINEFYGYSWDTKTFNEAVIKQGDHGMDALRYYIMTIAREYNRYII